MRSPILFALLTSLLCGNVLASQQSDLEGRRKALNDLLAERWEYTLRTNPIYASILGDKRWNDKLDDFSQKAIDDDLEQSKNYLTRFQAIDTTGFPEQEALNKTLMVRDLKFALEGARFKPWEMPVSQTGGVHIDLPQLVSVLSFQSVKDYDDYISRLRQVPRLVDENVIQMRRGVAEGLMPPRVLLEKVVEQANGLATKTPEDSPFAQPFAKFPDSISADDQKQLREQGLAAIRESVLPAYVKFTTFVREEYAPKGRTDPGVWALPDGPERYAFRVKESTTTDLSPEEIHQIGLAQVKEIQARMIGVANQLGYKDLKSFSVSLPTNPKLHVHSRQEILDLYQKYVDQMYLKLPSMFGRLPKARLQIMPIEEFREKEASTEYVQGSQDGSRPGHIMVNTGNYEKGTTLDFETTAYHEGVPGHHLQIAIAQELPELPPFRQNEYYTAYTEGWALYSERLGKEVGFFQDPYSYYGHLQDDMLRAIRLVVDTGFHYKHWTRQQVVDFFHDHSAIDEAEVQSETDRYMAWPAQALGYKIGQLEILKLRQYSKDQLGDKFSLSNFHDEVLGAGALPMDVLSVRIHEWVATQKANASTSMPGNEMEMKGAQLSAATK
ncbi:MAG TPA: DUF885 domain-containing protein [Candidatus Eremiobacteraceae bacterium]|nr:DUF885 domain-containing protein [Candidatus Eremiobacteraceae bacterium]